uniref:Uncharacterized protein n=1 Tax=Glossina pallidipes TaxID=7398 RepID=A0A1A9ZIR0_GLOPL
MQRTHMHALRTNLHSYAILLGKHVVCLYSHISLSYPRRHVIFHKYISVNTKTVMQFHPWWLLGRTQHRQQENGVHFSLKKPLSSQSPKWISDFNFQNLHHPVDIQFNRHLAHRLIWGQQQLHEFVR